VRDGLGHPVFFWVGFGFVRVFALIGHLVGWLRRKIGIELDFVLGAALNVVSCVVSCVI
jgi:hypothetical protein